VRDGRTARPPPVDACGGRDCRLSAQAVRWSARAQSRPAPSTNELRTLVVTSSAHGDEHCGTAHEGAVCKGDAAIAEESFPRVSPWGRHQHRHRHPTAAGGPLVYRDRPACRCVPADILRLSEDDLGLVLQAPHPAVMRHLARCRGHDSWFSPLSTEEAWPRSTPADVDRMGPRQPLPIPCVPSASQHPPSPTDQTVDSSPGEQPHAA
jgi:hypothetical protein